MTDKAPKFLIVDDQRSVREYVKTVLAEFGPEIVEVDSGEQALREVFAKEFDAVFLDISMAGIDGLEVCRRIRDEMGFMHLPVLIMTASEEQDIVADAFAAGASDYLRKHLLRYELVPRTRAILDRRHAQYEMYSARQAAEDANRAKTDFIANMSHELRTPLNAIIGFGELLEQDVERPLVGFQQEYVGHIVQAGWHLLALINDILDLAKIESGRVAVELTPVDVGKLVHECLQLNHAHAENLGVALRGALSADIHWQVMADSTRLKQALVNLISNAVKYNQLGGSAIVSVMPKGASTLRIVVRDTGHGIPSDKLVELFRPFSRLGAERSNIEGHGIGLALTKHLIELMGGTIGVDSKVGEGSSFWIELPMVAERQADLAKKTPEEAVDAVDARLAAASGKRVLYIEDNALNRTLITRILEGFSGIEVHCAETGEEGLAVIDTFQPDVLLLDIQLPGIGGHEVLRAVRRKMTIPIVVFSADAMPDEVATLMGDGATDYLTKPLDLLQFKQCLAGLIAS